MFEKVCACFFVFRRSDSNSGNSRVSSFSLHKEKYFHGSRGLELTAWFRLSGSGLLRAVWDACCLAGSLEQASFSACLFIGVYAKDTHPRPNSVGHNTSPARGFPAKKGHSGTGNAPTSRMKHMKNRRHFTSKSSPLRWTRLKNAQRLPLMHR